MIIKLFIRGAKHYFWEHVFTLTLLHFNIADSEKYYVNESSSFSLKNFQQ